ncbi:MAG: MFS transporter [Planctomycetota bacterium]|nr:MFS transporter [Planctomycetota bacterium]
MRRAFVAAGRAVAGRSPPTPYLARRAYALETTSTLFFAVALAAIDSGVLSVYARQTFDGAVGETRLNFAVALLGTMDALANILSFIWSTVGQGRAKIRLINLLQVGVIAAIAALAFMPRSGAGLMGLVALALTARVCWSGIITLRPTVWRSNYPREMRAQMVGRLSIIQAVVIAAGGAALGYALDVDRTWHRPAVLGACAVAAAAVVATSRQRVRRERQLLAREREGARPMAPWHGVAVVWKVLRADRRYAQFMLCMFVLGFGNLMISPILAIVLREQFGLTYFRSILLTSTVQMATQVVAIPVWARLLDRAHIVRFRAWHGWTFVGAGVLLVTGAATHTLGCFVAASVVLGIAYAGGTLAWSLGHVDFSPPSETSRYMATHVTLNGVRGLIAPITAVTIYESLKASGADAAPWVLGVSLVVSIAGCVGFVALRVAMEREMKGFVRTV